MKKLRDGNYALLECSSDIIDKDRYRIVKIGESISIDKIIDLKKDGLIRVLRVLTKEQFESLKENLAK